MILRHQESEFNWRVTFLVVSKLGGVAKSRLEGNLRLIVCLTSEISARQLKAEGNA